MTFPPATRKETSNLQSCSLAIGKGKKCPQRAEVTLKKPGTGERIQVECNGSNTEAKREERDSDGPVSVLKGGENRKKLIEASPCCFRAFNLRVLFRTIPGKDG